jgi:hypothetical protein
MNSGRAVLVPSLRVLIPGTAPVQVPPPRQVGSNFFFKFRESQKKEIGLSAISMTNRDNIGVLFVHTSPH